jgi:viroplasmin and RNaseH domain-containing protein
MYNTNFECRYYKDDVILETDNVNENEIHFIRNYLYKEDLLNIFNIDYGNTEEVFENSISELYEKIKNCKILKEFMEKASTIIFSNDIKNGLCILYSYDYMYLTHKCVSQYLDTGNISEENINLLKNFLK